MNTRYILILPLLCICMAVAAQNNDSAHHHAEDSTDVFFRHLQLNEVTVTGVTGDTKLKHSTAPVSIVTPQMLRSTASTNIIDAISRQPGISQLTTGGSISKPIIRGLGYSLVPTVITLVGACGLAAEALDGNLDRFIDAGVKAEDIDKTLDRLINTLERTSPSSVCDRNKEAMAQYLTTLNAIKIKLEG